MSVVCDTSPLNYLVLIQCVDVLPALFGQVYTAPAVIQEMLHPRSPEAVRGWAMSPPDWLSVEEPDSCGTGFVLGPGETAAISLAEQLHADWLLIDERDGREEARRRGQPIVGILSVLDRAAEFGLISLPEAVERLQATNFFVSEKLIQELLARNQKRKSEKSRDAPEN
jgi:predicted nucleic acid-binding protein